MVQQERIRNGRRESLCLRAIRHSDDLDEALAAVQRGLDVLAVAGDGLDGLAVDGVTGVAGVDVRVETLPVAGVRLDVLLVRLQGGKHVLVADIVEENALAHGADGDGGAELAIAGLEDGGGGAGEEGTVKLRVVHGQARAGEETEEAGVIGLGEVAADVGEGGRVGHVDGNGVAVAEGSLGDEFVERRPAEVGLDGE